MGEWEHGRVVAAVGVSASGIFGPNTFQDWCREGRRTFPILPRTAPYTALSYIANTVCEQISRDNARMPHPFETSQNRLQKEQEEEKNKLLEQQQKQQQLPIIQPTTQTLPVEMDSIAVPLTPPLEPIVHTPPPVVTMDPFVEAANKSYINNDLKRTYPLDPIPPHGSFSIRDDSPLRKKPQLYQELQKQDLLHQNPIVTYYQQPYQQQFPLQQALSPHNSLSSPTSIGTTPLTTNINNNNFNVKTATGKNSNKPERQRKTSVSSKKNQNKAKTSYQTNKQSGGSKASKNMLIPHQPPIPQVGSSQSFGAKGSGRGNNVSSPHLIHSYASPLLPYDIPQQGGGPLDSPTEPLQLQKHLTSNIVYQTQQSQQAFGTTAVPLKSPPFGVPYGVQQSGGSSASNAPPNSTNFGGQQQLLPSSKKDIQYNLTKLNPTNQVPMKNNLNIPLKPSSSSIAPGKNHPLWNYHKKSPSKNVLIPTSSAAATLASLGISKPIPRNNSPSGKYRDVEPIVNPADIPNPKIIFSTTGMLPSKTQHDSASRQSTGNQITILDQITLAPPNTIVQGSPTTGQPITIAPSPTSVVSNPTVAPSSNVTKSISPIGANVANKVVTLKGPNLAGFTPVKSGSKLSVHKLQLVPISQPGGKNNVIVLPAKTATCGSLNPGQKITIPKSVIDTNAAANIISPPKVIVQHQPDLNNIVVFDIGSDQKLKTSSAVLSSQLQPVLPVKSVITEDTPVDIVSTPLDVVTGAVKLQELSKGFLSPTSSASSSPLTEKMVKPQSTYSTSTSTTAAPKYNSNNPTKATKFEADSTAPGPSLTVTKKSKINHRSTPTAASTSAIVQSSKTVKSKPTAAVASSTTATGNDPSASNRIPAMSPTDWELELDQANLKTTPIIPKAIPKPTPKLKAAPAMPIPVPKSTAITALSNISSNSARKAPPPLSSSSISSTSSSSASSPVVVEQQSTSSVDARIQPFIHRPSAVPTGPILSVPAPVIPTLTSTPKVSKQTALLPLDTTPPNERSDDTSATDSADAEEDHDVGEEDDTIEEEMIIVDEQHFNAVIEEDPQLDETFNEQEIDGERVEIVNVGYDTSRALIADLEGTESAVSMQAEGTDVWAKNGVEINPSSMNFEQYIVEAEGEAEGEANEDSRTGSVPVGNGKNIMFEMLEIDAEGNKHTRTLSYEEAVAEGQIGAMNASSSAKSSGGSSGSGTVKGKTKSTS
ncbi:mucin-2-like [Topomyia yanbarensis]|uniref:mucin-2-like n=1 Tax=Topomyia yanbarensis TaxID=2498891 RepID=UPI00273ABDDE|nr:mucin-2-like [Topomyia yanbarensis]XP_058816372.1 mucin-2-like [Topomyia yanbarensis]